MLRTVIMIGFLFLLPAISPNVLAAPRSADTGGPVAWLHCTFGPLPEQEGARLHVMIVGDRVRRAVVEPFGLAASDRSGLKVADSRLTGTLVIGHDMPRMNRSLVPRMSSRMPIELSLTWADDQVTGSFVGSWRKPKSNDTPVPVEGKVTGVVYDEARCRKDVGLPDDVAWTSWSGPNQNFSAGPGGAPFVDDLHDARLVWGSQWIGPTESGSQSYGACVGCPPGAGGASPLVWRGRVYQFRHEAAGDAYQRVHLDRVMTGDRGPENREKMKAIGWTGTDLERRWAIGSSVSGCKKPGF